MLYLGTRQTSFLTLRHLVWYIRAYKDYFKVNILASVDLLVLPAVIENTPYWAAS
jgi:hypothetical protein